MHWSSDVVRNQLHPEVPHRRHDWVASRHLQGRPATRKLTLLSSVVSLSSTFPISSHVRCIICFLHQHLLDSSVRESDDDHNSADYNVIPPLSHNLKWEYTTQNVPANCNASLCPADWVQFPMAANSPGEKVVGKGRLSPPSGSQRNHYLRYCIESILQMLMLLLNPCSINDRGFFCAGNGAIQPPWTPQSPRLQKVPCNEVVRTADLTSVQGTFLIWIRQKCLVQVIISFHSGFSSS